MFNGGTVQAVQKHVAVQPVIGIVGSGAVFKDRVALHPQTCAERGRLADMVRLRGTLRDDHVGLSGQRLAHQELQLAGLVAAGGHPGAIVPLDPKPGPAQGIGQAIHRFQGRRQMGQPNTFKSREMHSSSSGFV